MCEEQATFTHSPPDCWPLLLLLLVLSVFFSQCCCLNAPKNVTTSRKMRKNGSQEMEQGELTSFMLRTKNTHTAIYPGYKVLVVVVVVPWLSLY